LYLGPKTPHTTDYDKRFANAAPLGFLGFVICVMSFAVVLMGWGGAGPNMAAISGMFFFVGPVLLLLSLIGLWIQNQFFPMMVCGLFSVFWLSFGMLQLPTLQLQASYAPAASPGSPPASLAELAAAGAASKSYNAVIALYLTVWGFAIFTFWLFTLRINLVFAGIFALTSTGSFVMSGAYWKVSVGNYAAAQTLQTTAGAIFFVVALLGWYVLVVMMAAEMRVTISLPVGDLSHYWKRTDVELAVMEAEKKD
ncbi:GPR1/FUN34/yaaH family-domain-containing protein, partial [Massariosphaeria phaeospora]